MLLYLLGSRISPTACAIEIEDGSTSFGMHAGMGLPQGSSSQKIGQAVALGGHFMHYPLGELGLGIAVDHYRHRAKAGTTAEFTSVLLATQANMEIRSDDYLPYFSVGAGYSEGRAELSDATALRGSGFGYFLGMGVDRFLTERLSLNFQFRYSRLGVPLPRLGLSGVTIAAGTVGLQLWLGPEGSPFKHE